MELRLYTSIPLYRAFPSTQLSKVGLYLPVSLFLQNGGGLVNDGNYWRQTQPLLQSNKGWVQCVGGLVPNQTSIAKLYSWSVAIHQSLVTKPLLFQRNRLTGSRTPSFESYVKGKDIQREIKAYSRGPFKIPHDCTICKEAQLIRTSLVFFNWLSSICIISFDPPNQLQSNLRDVNHWLQSKPL